MDEMLYNSLVNYYHALEIKGYMSYRNMQKLLLLAFYRDFVFHDYRGLITKEDYHMIERALDCLYGTTCLIPYPDYLKMGKLYLGQMTEMAQRIKTLEDTPVLKLMHDVEGIADTSDVEINVVGTASDTGGGTGTSGLDLDDNTQDNTEHQESQEKDTDM